MQGLWRAVAQVGQQRRQPRPRLELLAEQRSTCVRHAARSAMQCFRLQLGRTGSSHAVMSALQISFRKLDDRRHQPTITDRGCSIDAAASGRVSLAPGLSCFLIILIVLRGGSITSVSWDLFNRRWAHSPSSSSGNPDRPRNGENKGPTRIATPMP